MNFLLDTHVFLWWLGIPEELSAEEVKIVSDPKNTIYVSAASIWEISIKRSLGKLIAPDNIHEAIEQNDFFPLSITVEHANAVVKISKLHEDPFDRILIAQAITDNLILITRDNKIEQYSKSSMAKCQTALLF